MSKEEFVVASDVRGVLASGRVRPKLDPSAVQTYLALNYVPPDIGVYENVQPLPPGHRMTWSDGTVSLERYWHPYSTRRRTSRRSKPDHESASCSKRQCSGRRLPPTSKWGASSAVAETSATVAALMTPYADALSTFSVGFGDLIDELPFARAVAERFETKHYELQMDIAVGDALRAGRRHIRASRSATRRTFRPS